MLQSLPLSLTRVASWGKGAQWAPGTKFTCLAWGYSSWTRCGRRCRATPSNGETQGGRKAGCPAQPGDMLFRPGAGPPVVACSPQHSGCWNRAELTLRWEEIQPWGLGLGPRSHRGRVPVARLRGRALCEALACGSSLVLPVENTVSGAHTRPGGGLRSAVSCPTHSLLGSFQKGGGWDPGGAVPGLQMGPQGTGQGCVTYQSREPDPPMYSAERSRPGRL